MRRVASFKMEPVSEVTSDLSVVIPAFNAMGTLGRLVGDVCQVAKTNGWLYQIVIVDDSSKDRTWLTISELCDENSNILGIRMARNVGQQAATLAGLHFAAGSTVITMDDDFQHDPKHIPTLVKLCSGSGGDFEVVHALVKSRAMTLPRRILSETARRLFKRVLGIQGAEEYSSFRAIDKRAIVRLKNYRGPNLSVDVLLRWVTASFGSCPVSSGPQNPSRYKAKSLLRYAYLTSIGYSKRPLYLSLALGLIMFVATSLAILVVLLRAISVGQPPPGYLSLLLGLLTYAAAHFLLLGALSLYFSSVIDTILGRNHLPIAVVLENNKLRTGTTEPFL